MALCMNYIYATVIYMVVNLQNVSGEIGVNCGTGAVVGQPYRMECINIPSTVVNGIKVFLEGESNSIISCSLDTICVSRNSSLYNVGSPHNESLYVTIRKVTTDDNGKKLYCVDDTTLDPSSPSCTINTLPTNSEEMKGKCGSGAVVGQPYTMECINIPTTVINGINVFLGDTSNSIISCSPSDKNCAPRNSSLYSVVSLHTTSLSFTILNVTTDDIGKELYCVDDTTLDPSSPSCKINTRPTNSGDTSVLSGGEIAGLLIGSLGVFACISSVVIVMWKKKVTIDSHNKHVI